MTTNNRRMFLLQVAAGGSALALATRATAQAAANVDPKDAQAVALAYVEDTTKVDAKKYPKHSAQQKCSNCQLYAAKPTDARGPCPLFSNKNVAGNGWCTAWVKKA